MKLKVFSVFLVALLLAGSVSLAQDSLNWSSYMPLPSRNEQLNYRTTQRSPYIVCRPDFGDTKFTEYAVDFRAEHLPWGTYLAVGNWDMGSNQLKKKYKSVKRDYNGVAGYCGFQVIDDGSHVAILTLWDTYCIDKNGKKTTIKAKQIYPENNRGAEVAINSSEGDFLHCIIPYDWQEDRDYRALIQIANTYTGANAHLLYYVCDLSTGAWTRLMEFDLGYDEAYMFGMCTFLENYLPSYAGELRSMVLSNYRVCKYGTNKWIAAKRATFEQNYEHPGSYNYGSTGDVFWAITTGIPGLCSKPKDGKAFKVSHAASTKPY